MFYTFYIGTHIKWEELKNTLKKNLEKMTLNNVDIVIENNEEIEFDCSWFNLSITNNVKSILFTSEDYHLNLDYQFWFEVYYMSDGKPEEMMLELIGKILEKMADSGILLSNGDKPIIQKKDDKVTVDDSRLDSVERFPFQYLNIKYEEGTLIQV